MVKEGSFLNVDNEYPTKCSKLVHKKRSGRIIEDVSPSIHTESLHGEIMQEIQMRKAYKYEPQIVSAAEKDGSVQKPDEEIPESEAIFSPKNSKAGKAFKEMPVVQDSRKNHDIASTHPSPLSFPFPNIIPEPQHTRIDSLKSTNSDLIVEGSPRRNSYSNVVGRPLEIIPKTVPPERSLASSFSLPPPMAQNVSEDESQFVRQKHEDEIHEDRESCHDEEIAEAKIKLFLRFSYLILLHSLRALAYELLIYSPVYFFF